MSLTCGCCGTTENVNLEDSRTAYEPETPSRYQRLMFDDPLNDDPPDPNAPIPLCIDCAVNHHYYWDDRWQEFYNSRF